METLYTINASINTGLTRTQTVNGRRYIIAPATIIVEGVLSGSKGPLLYPKNEIERDYEQWNGRPLTNGHPVIEGKGVTANDPKIIPQYEIGRIYNTQILVDSNKTKLTTEAWFDEELTKAVNPKILKKLEKGEQIEVSTGLFTANIPAPTNSKYEGKPYTHIATNFKPDHLAILMDEKGACSIDHGCGVFNQENKQQEEQTNNCGRSKEGRFEGGNNCATKIKHIETEKVSEIRKVDEQPTEKEQDPNKETQNKNNYPESCPHCHTQLEIDPDSGICNRCGKKVEALESNKCGKQCSCDDCSFKVNSSTPFVINCTFPQENIMLEFKDRGSVIDWFVINVNKNATKQYVNEMTDQQIWDSVVRNAKEKMEDTDTPAFMKWMMSAPPDIQNSMVQLMKSQFRRNEGGDVDKSKEGKQAPTQAPTTPDKTQQPQQQPPFAKKDPEQNMTEEEKNKQNVVGNKVKSVNEYLNDPQMPSEVKEAIINSMNDANKKKADIISKLVVNVSAEKKQERIESLSKKGLKELEELLEFLPVNNNQNTNPILPVTHYIGNTGGVVANSNSNNSGNKRKEYAPLE